MTAVVDCQAHWYPPGFFELCEKRTAFPRCKRDGDGYLYELGPESFVPFSGATIDSEQLLAQMEGEGIDILVSSSEPLSVTGWKVEEAREAARVLNEEKARAQERHPGRFIGLATLPLQDPGSAMEELEHAIVNLRLGGVCMPSNVNGSAITGPAMMPLYERIDSLGVPLFLHPTKSIARDRLPDYGLDFIVGYMFDTTVAALNLVFSGTVQQCPGLKIVHPHLGATVPYLAPRIDIEFRAPWTGNEPMAAAPTEYLRSFYTDTVSDNPAALRMALDFYGVERVLFGSDFPWWEPKSALEYVRATLDDAEAEQVLSRNAQDLMRLE